MRKPVDDGVSVKRREQAMIGDVHVVKMDPGDKVFDTSGPVPRFLGIVQNGLPVINGQTCYLSADDYEAAKAALPKGPGVRLQ